MAATISGKYGKKILIPNHALGFLEISKVAPTFFDVFTSWLENLTTVAMTEVRGIFFLLYFVKLGIFAKKKWIFGACFQLQKKKCTLWIVIVFEQNRDL